MASILANLYGTEKDKVNCSFFYKIGACRHGEQCSRKHLKPTFSNTVLISNVYHNPVLTGGEAMDSKYGSNVDIDIEKQQELIDQFYEDWFTELSLKYGPIIEMHICLNISAHLMGNVYVQFESDEAAKKASEDLSNNRFYDGRVLYASLSPVSDFREARCRQYEIGECNRGGMCNFMHVGKVNRDLVENLFRAQSKQKRLDGYRSSRSSRYHADEERGSMSRRSSHRSDDYSSGRRHRESSRYDRY